MEYENGCIYLIYSRNSKRGYVGSTIQGIKKRLGKHEVDYRGYWGLLNQPRGYRSSFDIFEDGEYDIYLLENYPCECRSDLEKREQEWLYKVKTDIEITNKKKASRNTMMPFAPMIYTEEVTNLLNF